MKTAKVVLTLFAFVFAVAAAIGSEMMTFSETQGVKELICSSPQALNEGTCVTTGVKTECTIINTSDKAFLTTDCSVVLRIP